MKKSLAAAPSLKVAAAAAAVLPAALAAGQGADVSLCDIHQTTRWGESGGITSYSIGTTSVNVGNVNLNWIQNSVNHPVISQNMFRIMNGRFEQIGQSWLKHSFCALQIDSACTSLNCPNQGGCLSFLAPGCQDPYSAARNGGQTLLGPKWQVNPHTGQFSWPYANQGQTGDVLYKRLQVHNSDLGIPGAVYLVEGQYVALDDATAGNQNNNSSYRLVSIGPGPTYSIGFIAGQTTQFQRAAMYAWSSHGLGQGMPDTDVVIQGVQVPGDGLFNVGYKISDNGDGTYHYEYAIQNVNSHRGAQHVSVPVGAGAIVSNQGFHDVDYHSGDGEGGVTFDGTDWAMSVGGGTATWGTDTYFENINANALRWATTYNFRFDANTPPVPVEATITLYKPGAGGDPNEVTVSVLGPDAGAVCTWDLDGDEIVGINDLLDLLAAWNNPYTIKDLLDLLADWGPCP